MADNKMKIKNIPLRCYTMKELRMLYGVPLRTWREWIRPFRKEIGIGQKKTLNITQVKYIFEKFGIPGVVEIE